MNRPVNDMVDAFFADLEQDSRPASDRNLRAWLWFTCDAALRTEVETAIRSDPRWHERQQPASRSVPVRCKPVDEARLRRIMAATGITEVSTVFREAVRRWDEELARDAQR